MNEELKPCPFCGCRNVFTYISAFCAVIKCAECGAKPKSNSAIVVYKRGECPAQLVGIPTYEPELLIIRTKDGDTPYPDHGYVGVNAIDAFKAYGGFDEWNQRADNALIDTLVEAFGNILNEIKEAQSQECQRLINYDTEQLAEQAIAEAKKYK